MAGPGMASLHVEGVPRLPAMPGGTIPCATSRRAARG